MKNKAVWIGAVIGLILGFVIWISASNENIFGLPLFILAGIFIFISKIFLGPCPSEYGDFPCEDRISYILHNSGILIFIFIFFLFLCSFIGVLIGYKIGKIKRKR